jgi:prepilin-type N-terminal cleavage/methylation domain-containing protein
MRLLSIIKRSFSNQHGFTLIELTVALCITGLLVLALSGLFPQMMRVNDLSKAQISAVTQVENALSYINQDIQMAQSISAQDNTHFPLVLTWKSWETDKTQPQITYTVTYGVNSQGDFQRQYADTTGASNTRIVAKNISDNTADTNCTYDSASHKLTLQLTAIVAEGSKTVTEVRKVQIIPRPGS